MFPLNPLAHSTAADPARQTMKDGDMVRSLADALHETAHFRRTHEPENVVSRRKALTMPFIVEIHVRL